MSYDMIDRFLRNNLSDDDYAEYSAALDSLCTPQPKEPEQEPVAWKDKTYGNLHHQNFGNSIPLYTSQPPSKPWVGLTDEEILQTLDLVAYDTQAFDFAYRIETKLREKNT